jgi:hypothetical protein
MLLISLLPGRAAFQPAALLVIVFLMSETKFRFSGQKEMLLFGFQGLLVIFASAAVLVLLFFRVIHRKRCVPSSTGS